MYTYFVLSLCRPLKTLDSIGKYENLSSIGHRSCEIIKNNKKHPCHTKCKMSDVNAIHFFFLQFWSMFMSSVHLLLCLTLFPVLGCQSVILVAILWSFLRAVCPAHLHLAYFNVLMCLFSSFLSYFGRKHKDVAILSETMLNAINSYSVRLTDR